MKVNFKGKILNIKNESNSRKEFNANWNGYVIEVIPYEKEYCSYFNGKERQKQKYEGYCVNPLGSWICDSVSCNSISEAVQECFDNIARDIDDLKSEYDELGECLEKVKKYL